MWCETHRLERFLIEFSNYWYFFVFYLIYYRHFTCRILSSSLSYIEICIRRFHASEIQYQLASFKMCTNVPVFRFRKEKNRKFFRIKSWKQWERSTKNNDTFWTLYLFNDFHKIATIFIKFVYGPHLIPKLYLLLNKK